MLTMVRSLWLGLTLYWAAGTVGWTQVIIQTTSTGQVTTEEPVTDQNYQANVATFCANQQSLVQEQAVLIAQGATDDQLAAWVQQNADQFQLQLQSAQALSAFSEAQPMTLIIEVEIPADASEDLATLLTTQAGLYNDLAQIHNQLLANPSPGEDEMTLFAQEYQPQLLAQSALAQTVAEEGEEQPLPTPPPLVIPPGSSTQMQAYLTLRYQLMQAQAQFYNQYTSATPEVREAALEQWEDQNAASFQQLGQLGQNLTTTTTAVSN